MNDPSDNRFRVPEAYIGKILTGPFSRHLKKRIARCIAVFSRFENSGVPSIPYIAAWRENEKTIWYEFAARKFAAMMGCSASDIADVFKSRIVDRRTYRYTAAKGIQKDVVNHAHLEDHRDTVRMTDLTAGSLEAVYKVLPDGGEHLWLKDQAIIEIYPEDRICLSLGILTPVTKEMRAEEERERLVDSLREALANVKTLQGMLPICASCKKIRDDLGYWSQIENYLEDHSELSFSHSVCPDCFLKLYPDLKPRT